MAGHLSVLKSLIRGAELGASGAFWERCHACLLVVQSLIPEKDGYGLSGLFAGLQRFSDRLNHPACGLAPGEFDAARADALESVDAFATQLAQPGGGLDRLGRRT